MALARSTRSHNFNCGYLKSQIKEFRDGRNTATSGIRIAFPQNRSDPRKNADERRGAMAMILILAGKGEQVVQRLCAAAKDLDCLISVRLSGFWLARGCCVRCCHGQNTTAKSNRLCDRFAGVHATRSLAQKSRPGCRVKSKLSDVRWKRLMRTMIEG